MQPATVISRNGGGAIYYTIDGESLGAVEAAIARLEQLFHPDGYGTTFAPPKQQPDGSWRTTGHRSTTCD